MVASGVPEKTDHHASETAKMALDLLAKVIRQLRIIWYFYFYLNFITYGIHDINNFMTDLHV